MKLGAHLTNMTFVFQARGPLWVLDALARTAEEPTKPLLALALTTDRTGAVAFEQTKLLTGVFSDRQALRREFPAMEERQLCLDKQSRSSMLSSHCQIRRKRGTTTRHPRASTTLHPHVQPTRLRLSSGCHLLQAGPGPHAGDRQA